MDGVSSLSAMQLELVFFNLKNSESGCLQHQRCERSGSVLVLPALIPDTY